jgi:hypothetical protein
MQGFGRVDKKEKREKSVAAAERARRVSTLGCCDLHRIQKRISRAGGKVMKKHPARAAFAPRVSYVGEGPYFGMIDPKP